MATSGRQATVGAWGPCGPPLSYSLREEANEEASKASKSKDHDGCQVAIRVCLGVLVHIPFEW